MKNEALHTNAAWERVLKANRLLYPSEAVVRFLAKISGRHPSGSDAIDIGFGSGQHLKMLAEFGYRVHGTEMIADALERAQIEWKDSPQRGGFYLGDIDVPAIPRGLFAVGVAWGVVFLKPPAGVKKNLRNIFNLLQPGGDFCLNFRTPDNWFATLGTEIERGFIRMDARAMEYEGTEYCFFTEDEIREMAVETGFELVNIEQIELVKDNLSKRNVWLVAWLRKPQ